MDRCRICGMDFGSLSMGGPGICPACDCGIQTDSINHPKNHQYGSYSFTPNTLTVEDVRRIVKEELERRAAESENDGHS